MCVYIYIHTCTYMYIYIYIYTHEHISIHVLMCITTLYHYTIVHHSILLVVIISYIMLRMLFTSSRPRSESPPASGHSFHPSCPPSHRHTPSPRSSTTVHTAHRRISSAMKTTLPGKPPWDLAASSSAEAWRIVLCVLLFG